MAEGTQPLDALYGKAICRLMPHQQILAGAEAWHSCVKNNATHFSSYKDHHMKLQLVVDNLAIWMAQEFKHNVVRLYMAQMVYAEVALSVEMDWSNIPTSSWS